jgi:hypothetical protein
MKSQTSPPDTNRGDIAVPPLPFVSVVLKDGKPVAEPYTVMINRVMQEIIWQIDAPNIGWDNSNTPPPDGPGGPNKAVQIDMNNVPPWTGGTPQPIGQPPQPGELDTRKYRVNGPGPNMGNKTVIYGYLMWVVDDAGNRMRVQIIDDSRSQIPVDPDIGNQPQP